MKTLNKEMLDKFSDSKNKLFVRIMPEHPAHVEMLKMLPGREYNTGKYTYYGDYEATNSIPEGYPAIPIEAMFNEDPTTEDVMGWNEEYRLFYCKWRYPQGCVYRFSGVGKEHICDHNADDFGELHWGCSNISAGFLKGYLFCDGKWAEIVSLPADDTKPAEPEQPEQPEQAKPEADQPELIPVTQENYREGMKVVRGKDWAYEDQDGGEGNVGELINNDMDGWAWVKWPNGCEFAYMVGFEDKYDLYIAPGEPEYGQAGATEPRETPPDTDREIVGWRLNIDVPEWGLSRGDISENVGDGVVSFKNILLPMSILMLIASPIYGTTFTTEAGTTVTLTEGDIQKIVNLKK